MQLRFVGNIALRNNKFNYKYEIAVSVHFRPDATRPRGRATNTGVFITTPAGSLAARRPIELYTVAHVRLRSTTFF